MATKKEIVDFFEKNDYGSTCDKFNITEHELNKILELKEINNNDKLIVPLRVIRLHNSKHEKLIRVELPKKYRLFVLKDGYDSGESCITTRLYEVERGSKHSNEGTFYADSDYKINQIIATIKEGIIAYLKWIEENKNLKIKWDTKEIKNLEII